MLGILFKQADYMDKMQLFLTKSFQIRSQFRGLNISTCMINFLLSVAPCHFDSCHWYCSFSSLESLPWYWPQLEEQWLCDVWRASWHLEREQSWSYSKLQLGRGHYSQHQVQPHWGLTFCFNPLIHESDQYRILLLKISIQYQPDKWWE